MPASVLTPAPERTNSRGYCCANLWRSFNPLSDRNDDGVDLASESRRPKAELRLRFALINSSSWNLILRTGATHGFLTHTLGLRLSLVELGAPARDLLGSEPFNVAVIEPPVGAGAPSQRRLHGRSCGRRGFENSQCQLERADLRL